MHINRPVVTCDPERVDDAGRYHCRNCERRYGGLYPNGLPPKRNCSSGTPPRPRNDCKFLGDKLGTRECESCQGTVRIKLFACELHGQCTLGKKLDGMSCCANCHDYQPSKRDASPDDGRNG